MNKIKLLLPALSVLFSNICLGVLPPEYLIARKRNAKIKAVAIVKSVKPGFYNKETGLESQTVVFETVTPLVAGKFPKNFTGYCYSLIKATGYVGGEVYYYPKKSLNKQVYVAIDTDGGQIAALRPLTKDERIKLENQFKNRDILLGQVKIKNLTNSIHCPFDDLYLFKVNGEVLGCFEHKKNRSYPQAYMSELYFKTEKSFKKYSVRTYYSGDGQFQLNEMHLDSYESPNHSVTVKFGYSKSKTPAEGVLKKSGEYPAASNTVSDFTLFSIVSLLPFDEKLTLDFTLVESLELNVRKGMKLKFSGEDKGLFKFIQFDSQGNCTAQYWLDKDHTLHQVAWDKGRMFVRTSKDFSIKDMNEQQNQKAK